MLRGLARVIDRRKRAYFLVADEIETPSGETHPEKSVQMNDWQIGITSEIGAVDRESVPRQNRNQPYISAAKRVILST
jgi:hypothetical protein